ncbi:hypothetical protein MANES_06G140200v8 [Manihot esculenta]|uniref:Uncharacterized protein n=1 Tax=Manihot esculenta TaxID=3983 RepID=A0ACB7HL09_MANES|nr:hypothetical protein MANES_06G140200v8 [Manihot esculenta]
MIPISFLRSPILNLSLLSIYGCFCFFSIYQFSYLSLHRLSSHTQLVRAHRGQRYRNLDPNCYKEGNSIFERSANWASTAAVSSRSQSP